MSLFDIDKLVDQAQVKDGFTLKYCSKITDDTWFEQLEKNFSREKCKSIIKELNTRENGSSRTDQQYGYDLITYLSEKNIIWNDILIYLILVCMFASGLEEQYLQGLYNRCLSDKIIKDSGWVSVTVDNINDSSGLRFVYIKISINYAVSQSLTIVLEGK